MGDKPPNSNNCIATSTIRRYTVNTKQVESIASTIMGLLGIGDFALSICVGGNKRIRTLNKTYRSIDKSTDVLSFPQIDFSKPLSAKPKAFKSRKIRPQFNGESIGDIFISAEIAEVNAKNIGQGLDREICFLLVHGILHLCGHDHMNSSEESLMLTEQRKIMKTLDQQFKTKPIWKNCIKRKKV